MSKKSRSSKRVGLGQYKKELTLPPGLVNYDTHVPRWINDEADRLHAAEQAGWSFVENKDGADIGEGVETGNTDLGSRISKVVDKAARKVGEPMRAYLMQIKREWYDADQKAKIDNVEEIDRQIAQGDKDLDKTQRTTAGDDPFYKKMKYQT